MDRLWNVLTEFQYQRLLINGIHHQGDHQPVVRIFIPDAQATWLLTELSPENPDIAFGLCDLGLGFPQMGTVSMSELDNLIDQLELPVECDRDFVAMYRISVYAAAARKKECITTNAIDLAKTAIALKRGK